jgi:hypothetical protein
MTAQPQITEVNGANDAPPAHDKVSGFFAQLYSFINGIISGSQVYESLAKTTQDLTDIKSKQSEDEEAQTNNLSTQMTNEMNGTNCDNQTTNPDPATGIDSVTTDSGDDAGTKATKLQSIETSLKNLQSINDNKIDQDGSDVTGLTNTVSGLNQGASSYMTAGDAMVLGPQQFIINFRP